MWNTVTAVNGRKCAVSAGRSGGTGLAVCLAWVLGLVGLIGGIQPVRAEHIKVEPVQMADFSGIIKSIRPAVVNIKARSEVSAENKTGSVFSDLSKNRFFQFGVPQFQFFNWSAPIDKNLPKDFMQFGTAPDEFANGNADDQEFPGEALSYGQANIPGNAVGQSWFYSEGKGSGFFISEDGFIVTNQHLIQDAENITVVTDSGEEYQAELIGGDIRTDLALLKIDSEEEFKYVHFGQSLPEVGEWVIGVGNPTGLSVTPTAGIVSARGRDIGVGPFDDFIKIDAPVNHGNSGGPAFNLRGELIGVIAAIFTPFGNNVGNAFIIPSSLASNIVMDLKDNGKVVRGWLGVQVQQITNDFVEQAELPSKAGALISNVQPDSPALKAGLQLGDVILQVQNRKIRNPRELASLVGRYTPGTAIEMTILRNGAEQNVQLELARVPTDSQSTDQVADVGGTVELWKLGFAVANAKEAGKGDEGVVITSVEPGSVADLKNLAVGTVILQVAGQKVSTMEQVAARMHEVKLDGRSAVLLLLKHEDSTRFVALSIKDI